MLTLPPQRLNLPLAERIIASEPAGERGDMHPYPGDFPEPEDAGILENAGTLSA
ncbi:hypothetical protein [Phaeovulum sp. W22_SRMD_FR3]|uniref:hypothetical protein n=1 Tax=Phaeovulum sp. W22_SRMD_FR3 TaxID=3240274 RepID=UPI003F94F6F9